MHTYIIYPEGPSWLSNWPSCEQTPHSASPLFQPQSLCLYTPTVHINDQCMALNPTLSISWLDDSFFWEFQAGHPLSTFFCRFLSCQDALMIIFFNPPSTHRLDNDPVSGATLRCGVHLAQNRPRRSLSSPWDIGKLRFLLDALASLYFKL